MKATEWAEQAAAREDARAAAARESDMANTGRIELVLPFPPTVNTNWRSVIVGKEIRVVRSQKARDYTRHIGWLLRQQARGVSFGRFERLRVRVLALPPDLRARDLDNLLKCLLDSLQAGGLFDNDRQIDSLAIDRGPPLRPAGQVRVTVERMPG